jgi:WD40 repeat protein
MTPHAYYVAAGGSNYNVYLLNQKGEFSWMHNPAYWISSVSLSSNGSYLAAGSFDNKIYLFNSTGTKLWDYQAKDDIYNVAISPDTSFIAAGSWDDTLYVLNMEGDEFWNYSCGGNINTVSISCDSSALAAGSDDGAAYLFKRNSTVFARLFGDERFLSGEKLKELSLDQDGGIELPLKAGKSTTRGIENVVEIASASSGKVAGDIKSEDDPAAENSTSAKSSSKLSGLLTFFKFPIVLLLAVSIVAIFLRNRTLKRQTRDENFEDFENLDDEKDRPGN